MILLLRVCKVKKLMYRIYKELFIDNFAICTECLRKDKEEEGVGVVEGVGGSDKYIVNQIKI